MNQDDSIPRLPSSFPSTSYSDIPLLCLIFLHISIVILLMIFRKNRLISSIIITILCIFIALTQQVNIFLSSHWSTLSFSHNYFSHGTSFIFLHWTLPFLIVVSGFIINMVYELLTILQLPKIIYYDEEKSPKIDGKKIKKDE